MWFDPTGFLREKNMAKKLTMHRQCVLEKRLSDSSLLRDVSWIPATFAKVGRNLSLLKPDDLWSDGWIVMSVGNLKAFEELAAQDDAQREFQRKLGLKKDRRKEG